MVDSPPDMPLGMMMLDFLTSRNFTFEQESLAAEKAVKIGMHFKDFRLFMKTDDAVGFVTLAIYFPFDVYQDHTVKTLFLLNHINMQTAIGRLAIETDEGDGSASIQFLARFDLEGCTASPLVFANLMRAGLATVQRWKTCLAAVALTPLSWEEAVAQHEGATGRLAS